MSNATHCSPFLKDLLLLQQDGQGAISAPTNWTRAQPLLYVPTEIDEIIRQLANSSLTTYGSGVAKWCFLIGSPGNGKSAAVGELVRCLISDHSCRLLTPDERPLDELTSEEVPYQLDVFEPGKTYPTLRIVQDASVVRNPYSENVDPARDLIDTIKDCWRRGIALVVCTNRGVLEKAYQDIYLDPLLNQEVWFKAIVKPLCMHDTTSPCNLREVPAHRNDLPFQQIQAQAHFLDVRSLLLKSGTFRQLLSEATAVDKWEVCDECPSRTLCPFRANRQWLATPVGSDYVIALLRRAEVLSSQIIVFREAVALVSYLLAGCARDYASQHPCEWVHDRVHSKDYFTLACRRLHMSLFCSPFPRGLETHPLLTEPQRQGLQSLFEQLSAGTDVAASLELALHTALPSADVGVNRLLGASGVLQRLDPVYGPLPPGFYDSWDCDGEAVANRSADYLCELDRKCIAMWSKMESCIEKVSPHDAPRAYKAVRRWSSNYTMHIGVLVESLTRRGQDIDEFSELLVLLATPNDERTVEHKMRIHALEEQIQLLLLRVQSDAESRDIPVSRNVAVRGNWVHAHLRAKIEASAASGSLSVGVNFGAAKQATQLTGEVYLWIKDRATGDLMPECSALDVLADAIDARARALSRSAYAYVRDDVTVVVREEGNEFTITRVEGECSVVRNI